MIKYKRLRQFNITVCGRIRQNYIMHNETFSEITIESNYMIYICMKSTSYETHELIKHNQVRMTNVEVCMLYGPTKPSKLKLQK